MPVTWRLFLLYTTVAGGVAAAGFGLRRAIDRRALILFLVLPVIFLGPGFFSAKTPLALDHVRAFYTPWKLPSGPAPHNPTLNDVATQFVPWAKAVRVAWKEGSLPFRNRWNGCGMPLAANGQSQAFSPFTFLMFALPLAQAFVLLAGLKLFLALSGMWLWIRELGASRQAACLGSVAFGFSFAMTPWLYHPATAGICLWPWAFFAIELLQDQSVRRRAFWALVVIFTIWPLTGHLETLAIGALLGGLWLFARALTGDLRQAPGLLLRAGTAALLAIGLSAFSLVPQLFALGASNRLALAEDPNRFSFVPWVPYQPGWLGGFYTAVLPRTFGDGMDSPFIRGAAGSMTEMGFAYFGIVGWACALLVLFPGSSRGRRAWISLGLIVFGLAAAMGLPVFRAFAEHIPGIGLTPPLRLLLLVAPAGAVLAALEIDRLQKDFSRNRWAALRLIFSPFGLGAFALFAFFRFNSLHAAVGGLSSQKEAMAWTLGTLVVLVAAAATSIFKRRGLSPKLIPVVCTVLCAIELIYQGMRLYRFYSPADLYPEAPLIRFLASRPGLFRVVGEADAVFPNTNVFAALEEIRTHDPAERRDYVQFLDSSCGYAAFDYFKRIRDLNAPALDFLNVVYLISDPNRESPGSKWRRVYAGPDGTVFQNRNALPRLFAPPEIELVSPELTRGLETRKNAMAAFGRPLQELIAASAFHQRAAILAEGAATSLRKSGTPRSRTTISDIREWTNKVSFQADVPEGPAVLVSSFVQDGGWSAVDASGRQLPTLLANGPFLAILLPPGRHAVLLKYVPPGFRVGAAISITSVGAILLIVCASRVRQRRSGRSRQLP